MCRLLSQSYHTKLVIYPPVVCPHLYTRPKLCKVFIVNQTIKIIIVTIQTDKPPTYSVTMTNIYIHV